MEFCNGGLSNVGVLLLDATKQRVLGFTLTDERGQFHFKDLPFGTYHVMADLPRYGRGMCEEITISAEQPSVNGLHLFVDQEGRVNMRYPSNGLFAAELQVYPNPVKETVTVTGLSGNTAYEVTVLNSMGMKVLPENQLISNLLGELSASVSTLPGGIYFIRLRSATNTVMAKFVKQ